MQSTRLQQHVQHQADHLRHHHNQQQQPDSVSPPSSVLGLPDSSHYSRLQSAAVGPPPPSYYGGGFRSTGNDVASNAYFQSAGDIYRPAVMPTSGSGAMMTSSLLLSSSTLATAAGSGYYEKCAIWVWLCRTTKYSNIRFDRSVWVSKL